jgi:hypothetical protein
VIIPVESKGGGYTGPSDSEGAASNSTANVIAARISMSHLVPLLEFNQFRGSIKPDDRVPGALEHVDLL